eukprot:TRINITY_DN4422_c0_g1_i1.p1 TRINITY_DN4422_c0_g1~~TRINITY_DN4422_c0_g1_i1.p1  ORF type:complete len:535 (+),score=83.90 TRINITY_DN4422_c0_g1_i1:209-1813(+)
MPRRRSVAPQVGKLLGDWRSSPPSSSEGGRYARDFSLVSTLKKQLAEQDAQHLSLKTAFEEEVKLLKLGPSTGDSEQPGEHVLKMLKDEIDKLKHERNMMSADNQILSTTAAHSNAEAKGWEIRYNDLLESMKANQRQLEEQREAASRSAIEVQELSRALDDQRKETSTAHDQCHQLQEELKRQQAISEALERERDLACQRMGFVPTSADCEKCPELERKVADGSLRLELMSKECGEYQSQIVRLEESLTAATATIESSHAKILALESELNVCGHERNSLETKLRKFKGLRSTTHRLVVEHQEQIESGWIRVCTGLQRELTRIGNSLRSIQKQAEACNQSCPAVPQLALDDGQLVLLGHQLKMKDVTEKRREELYRLREFFTAVSDQLVLLEQSFGEPRSQLNVLASAGVLTTELRLASEPSQASEPSHSPLSPGAVTPSPPAAPESECYTSAPPRTMLGNLMREIHRATPPPTSRGSRTYRGRGANQVLCTPRRNSLSGGFTPRSATRNTQRAVRRTNSRTTDTQNAGAVTAR